MLRGFGILLFCLLALAGQSQDSLQYVQVSGLIMNEANNLPISGVTITNETRSGATRTNSKGFFTLPTVSGDRLVIAHVGMESRYIDVPHDQGSKVFENLLLDIDPTLIKTVVVELPAYDELLDEMMRLDVPTDEARELAERNPDVFNVLDSIEAYGAPILRFRNGEIQSSPITWFYENVYKKIKEKLPKPKRAEKLPKWREKKSDDSSN